MWIILYKRVAIFRNCIGLWRQNEINHHHGPLPRKVLCNKAGGVLNYIPISAQAHTRHNRIIVPSFLPLAAARCFTTTSANLSIIFPERTSQSWRDFTIDLPMEQIISLDHAFERRQSEIRPNMPQTVWKGNPVKANY